MLVIRAGLLWALALLAVAGCVAESTDPIVPTTSLPAHAVTPTPEMEQYARQQCLDDPELETGVVEVLEPETDTIVARIEVPCGPVRAEGQPES